MKLKKVIIFFLLSFLLISLTACDTAKDNLTDIQNSGQLKISTNLSQIEKAVENSQGVKIQSVVEERFSNYKIVVTITHKDTAEEKSEEENVKYKENASFSFDELTPGNWEVQATLKADYSGEEAHVLETGEELNEIKIGESEEEVVEIKENETTTAKGLTLRPVGGDVALKVGSVTDENYELNEIILSDNNDEIVKSDKEIGFGDEIDSWASALNPYAHQLEVDWAIGDSHQQQERLLIPIPGLTIQVEVEFYDGKAHISIGWDMPPSVPTNVKAKLEEESGQYSTKISWDEINKAEKYYIERKVNNDSWEKIGEVNSAQEYIDQDLEENKVYKYAVIAADESGRTSDRSQPTEEISIPDKTIFKINDISIDPVYVDQGENIEISADIFNTANYETDQDIVLNIDFGTGGVVEKTGNISLAAFTSTTAVFNIEVPADADTGETTATVSSDHDSSNQSFNLGFQKITFAEQSQLNGVTITIKDSNDKQVAQIDTAGSYVSGIAEIYLERGAYNYTATLDDVEETGSFSVVDEDKTQSFRLDFAGGKGTEAEPYLITNWYHLDNLRDYGVTNGSNYEANTYFALDNDLNRFTPGYNQLAGAVANSRQGWEPIGDGEISNPPSFTGVFDGQENVISDLFIDRDNSWIGLFSVVNDNEAKIQNLGLENLDIKGDSFIGGLVGGKENTRITIDNCHVTGSVTGTGSQVGGLIGYMDGGEGVINNSYTELRVKGNQHVGGLMGYISFTKLTIDNSYTLGDVSGKSDLGGFVGYVDVNYVDKGEISNSYATGDVTGTGSAIGGFAGYIVEEIRLENCYAEGNVKGRDDVGGFAGHIKFGIITSSYALGAVGNNPNGIFIGGLVGYNYGSKIKNSYALGSVSNYGRGQAGGLVGYNYYGALVENCYAAGSVNDESTNANIIGGLIGRNDGTVNNSYYDKDTTGQSSSDGGTPKTTTEMMQQATFDNWDFNSTWTIDEENSYPSLQWQDD